MRSSAQRIVLLGLWLALTALRCAGQGAAAPAQFPSATPQRITEAIDEQNLIRLSGNVHPLARTEFDRGPVPDAQPLHRMLLLLQRGTDQETALQQLLDDQQNKVSPNYQGWLTPEQFGRQFGPADGDIQTITQWLSGQGFTDVKIGAGRTVIEFSGNAGQVRQAFHTEIHQFAVKGALHFANAGDPQIPAALATVVAGIVSLHDFPVKSHLHRVGLFQRSRETGETKPLFTFPGCQFGTCYGVGPADFATIYNTKALLNATPKIDGTGQGIAIVGDSNINVQDVADFRTMFGLPQNFTSANVIVNGTDPGIIDSEDEADLDVQWSGAVAPGARIDFVTSESTETTSGIHLSAVYIVDHNVDAILSESFGDCEKVLGTSLNHFYNSLWEQAAAQGITVILSAGDGGSAGCDDFNNDDTATQGLAVSGFASTPFDVAVGGTDFDQAGRESVFWATTPTPSTLPVPASAKSYIPEVPWNDSCAQNGINGCKAGTLLNIVAGSGGSSTIYAKPSWQAGKGVPNDAHRDLPDVSLFAGNGFNNSFYIMCQRDAAPSGTCDLTAPLSTFLGVGGTSASAPAFAGIMALVNQKQATAQNPAPRQGIANYVLYGLAAQQNTANLACNSSATPVSGCNLNDVTKGNNDVPCTGGSTNCSSAAAAVNGVLVATPGSTTPAYTTTAGYDLATGLGSVNAANLAAKWGTVNTTPSSTTLTLNGGAAVNVTHGQAISFQVGVSPTAATGDVSLVATPSAGTSVGVGPFTLTAGAASGSTMALPGGTNYNVTAHYEGNGTYKASDSTSVVVTIAPEASNVQIKIPTFDSSTGNETSANATSILYGSPYLLRVDVANSAGTLCNATTIACPTGSVAVTDNGNSLDAGTYPLNSSGFTEDQVIQVTQLPGGTHTIKANYSGDGSYAASSATDAITITPAATTMTAIPPDKAVATESQSFIAYVSTQSFGAAPTGTMTLYDGTTKLTDAFEFDALGGTLFRSTAQIQAYFTNVMFSTNGTHNVVIKYSGDKNYSAATATLTVPVYYRPSVIIKPSGTNLIYGDSLSFTAIIDTNVPNLPPTGTVTFFGNGPGGPVTYSQVLGPSGNQALQATLAAFVPQGSVFMRVTYSGDSNYTNAENNSLVNVEVPDFSLSENPTALTITPGQPVISNLTITPLNTLSGSATFNCSQPFELGLSCTVSPATVALTNGAPVNATVTLSLPLPAASASAKAFAVAYRRPEQPWWGGTLGGLILAWFLVVKRPKRYRLAPTLGICALVACVLGCGGGTGGGSAGSTGGGNGGGGTSEPTTVTVTLLNSKVPAGTPVTATATVTSSGMVNGGTATFFDKRIAAALGLPVTVTNGVARVQFGANLGVDQIYASYTGASQNSNSQSAPVTIIGTGSGTVQINGAINTSTVHAVTLNYTIQ